MPAPWPGWNDRRREALRPDDEVKIIHGNDLVITLAGQNLRWRFDLGPPVHPHHRRDQMIVTTTPTVEGYPVTQYLRVVCGETIAGVNMFKDIAAGFRNMVGGRSQSYENELIQARETALAEMVQRAQELGAEGVVGVDIDYETLGSDNGMLMVTASGTAVRFSH